MPQHAGLKRATFLVIESALVACELAGRNLEEFTFVNLFMPPRYDVRRFTERFTGRLFKKQKG